MRTCRHAVERQPLFYRLVLSLAAPVVRRWARLDVVGEHLLAGNRALLVVGNHDSYWDPVVVGVAALPRRHIRAVAKSELWRIGLIGWVLDRMGQLKLTRGRVDRAELTAIAATLDAGGTVGIFPEGRISLGRRRRAYSGTGWLARRPGTRVVAVAITGAVDIVRFPRRPRIRVEFFEPTGGPLRPGESSIGFSRRLTAEIRAKAPYAASGRHPAARLQSTAGTAPAEPLVRPGAQALLRRSAA